MEVKAVVIGGKGRVTWNVDFDPSGVNFKINPMGGSPGPIDIRFTEVNKTGATIEIVRNGQPYTEPVELTAEPIKGGKDILKPAAAIMPQQVTIFRMEPAPGGLIVDFGYLQLSAIDAAAEHSVDVTTRLFLVGDLGVKMAISILQNVNPAALQALVSGK